MASRAWLQTLPLAAPPVASRALLPRYSGPGAAAGNSVSVPTHAIGAQAPTEGIERILRYAAPSRSSCAPRVRVRMTTVQRLRSVGLLTKLNELTIGPMLVTSVSVALYLLHQGRSHDRRQLLA